MSWQSIQKLKPGMIAAKDVYVGDDRAVPALHKGTVLTSDLIRRLKEYRVMQVNVADEYEPSEAYVLKAPPVIDEDLQREAIGSLVDLFASASWDEGNLQDETAMQAMKGIDAIVDRLVAAISKDRAALININDLKSYDEYIYHHSLSVAVLSIAIGQSMGFSVKQLNWIGKCAMLHDIGKAVIPVEIINKPSKLSPRELEIIKIHAMAGYEYLAKSDIAAEDMWLGILFHHEKYDGTGYPKGLKGKEIPLLSRIISVADVYDALTSSRPYRSPMQPLDGVEYVMANVGSAFDYDVVTAFLKKLELYPVGAPVELSNRKIAYVLDNEHAMRPIVRLEDTGEVLDLYRDFKRLNLTIRGAASEDILLEGIG